MNGVGTELRKIFRWWGFRPTDSCKCSALRKQYDTQGPQWCQEHITEIVDEILEESQKRKRDMISDIRNLLPALSLSMPQPVQRIVLTRIVQVCINRTLKCKGSTRGIVA